MRHYKCLADILFSTIQLKTQVIYFISDSGHDSMLSSDGHANLMHANEETALFVELMLSWWYSIQSFEKLLQEYIEMSDTDKVVSEDPRIKRAQNF